MKSKTGLAPRNNFLLSNMPVKKYKISRFMMSSNKKNKPLILIYSKSSDILLLIKTFLRLWNYRIKLASDKKDLMRLPEKESPTILLFDLSFDFENDLMLLRQLRAMNSLNDIPIIVLSGHARSGDANTALAAGADEYFIKPLDFDRLRSEIKKYSSRQEINSRVGEFI